MFIRLYRQKNFYWILIDTFKNTHTQAIIFDKYNYYIQGILSKAVYKTLKQYFQKLHWMPHCSMKIIFDLITVTN